MPALFFEFYLGWSAEAAMGATIAIAAVTYLKSLRGSRSLWLLGPVYAEMSAVNPVIVLMILTIGGKLFHVWGFILGVPVFTYIFGHAIRPHISQNKEAEDEEEVAVPTG